MTYKQQHKNYGTLSRLAHVDCCVTDFDTVSIRYNGNRAMG